MSNHFCIGEVAPNYHHKTRHVWLLLVMVVLVAALLIGGWHLAGMNDSIHAIASFVRG